MAESLEVEGKGFEEENRNISNQSVSLLIRPPIERLSLHMRNAALAVRCMFTLFLSVDFDGSKCTED